ncbi:glycosyltransferase [Patescibacteria group bacterium]|nr:glycosyltransferase [Patescibacteria group bacterium]MBU1868181.1 glycosyltransferase [Patescibacteria group bacterium]
MRLSVIIPVYNGEETIKRSMEAIFNQTIERKVYEVIVINDGSTDGTQVILQRLKSSYTFQLITQANLGAAISRNQGIKKASQEIIVLIQDDIIVDPNFLAEHLRFHQMHDRENTAVVGFTTWDPRMRITPFMRWLEHGGPQFDYDRIKGKLEVDHLAFYTCNLSVRRSFINKVGLLNENFSLPGVTAYEDTEWGWRLAENGLRIWYNLSAIAYHHHPRTLVDVCQRRYREGKMSHVLYEEHPGLKMVGENDSWLHNLTHLKTGFLTDKTRYQLTRLVFNRFTFWPLERLARFCETRINFPLLYKIVCGYWYNKGYAHKLK